MELALDANVTCTDGAVGRVSAIILDPTSKLVTHVVVKGTGSLIGEYLVPVAMIAKASAKEMELSWGAAELAEAERFDKAILVNNGGAEGGMLWPYAAAGEMNFGSAPPAAFVQIEEAPDGGIAVHVGAHVNATDGRIGQVDELVIDHKTSTVTHLVLRHGHLWGKEDITVPVSAIQHVHDDTVYLKLDKKAVKELPASPIHKE